MCISLAARELAGQNAGERRRAARSLARQGADAIPQLAPLLADVDLEVRDRSRQGPSRNRNAEQPRSADHGRPR